MTLHLYSFEPDLPRLMRLAARERLLPLGDDPGYAVHAVLAASFGAHAPKPWALLAAGRGGGPAGRLLGYGAAPLDTLLAHAATYADPGYSSVLALDRAATREMPVHFVPGTRLGFRVRLRPMARTGKPLPGHPSAIDRGERARERDVYLARVDAAERATAAGADRDAPSDAAVPSPSNDVPSRAECYLDWLDARLRDAGAALARVRSAPSDPSGTWDARVDAFRLTRLLSRDRSGSRARPIHAEGPDAVVVGTLTVTDADAFGVGLARGLGRYRAFGFGMLLLTPPRG